MVDTIIFFAITLGLLLIFFLVYGIHRDVII